MKRLILIFLLFCLISTPVMAAKKVLFLRPDTERDSDIGFANVDWTLLSCAGALIQAGGDYETVILTGDADSLDAYLDGLSTDDYGLVIIPIMNQYSVTLTQGMAYEPTTLTKYINMDKEPLAIKTLVISVNQMYRYAQASDKRIYNGVKNQGTWQASADSLWAETSEGDTMLWTHPVGEAKHFWDIDQAPESSYDWAWDIRSKADTNCLFLWHVDDGDKRIYYLPYYSQVGINDKVKTVLALAKKHDCLDGYIPFNFEGDDFGFFQGSGNGDWSEARMDSVFAGDSTMFQWCHDNEVYINIYTSQSKTPERSTAVLADGTPNIYRFAGIMSAFEDSPYVTFGWGGDVFWEPAAGATRTLFVDWGNDAHETGDSLLSLIGTEYDSLGAKGFLPFMDASHYVFYSHNYMGAAGENQPDTIMGVLASKGVRSFRINGYCSGYYQDGSRWFTILAPYRDYPINYPTGDSWADGTATAYCNMKIVEEFSKLGDYMYNDISLENVAIARGDSLVSAFDRFYGTFNDALLGSGRLRDGIHTPSANRYWNYIGGAYESEWNSRFDMNVRGITYYAHQRAVWSRVIGGPGTTAMGYNTFLMAIQHVWNNLEAYNNLAGADVFKTSKASTMLDSMNDTFPSE